MTASKTYFITWFSEDANAYEKLKSAFDETAAHGYIAREIGEQSNKVHFHILVVFKKAQRFNAVVKWFEEHVGGKHPNVQKTIWKDACQSYVTKYLDYKTFGSNESKQGKRNDIAAFMQLAQNGVERKDAANQMPAAYAKYHAAYDKIVRDTESDRARDAMKIQYQDVTLKKWQRKVIEYIPTQPEREILWVWESVGNRGKSWLAKYMAATMGAFYVRNGKSSDIAMAYNKEAIVVYDLTRDQQELINYNTMESFKDGMLWSPKYESEMKQFPPCKVVVFANWPPAEEKLSEDRLNIVELKGKKI